MWLVIIAFSYRYKLTYNHTTLLLFFIHYSLVPVRDYATESTTVTKRKPYSPFQGTTNNVEYALARADDLVNWARKVRLHYDYTF